MQHHKYSLTELENMMPWEREIYIGLLKNILKKRKRHQKQENKTMPNKYQKER